VSELEEYRAVANHPADLGQLSSPALAEVESPRMATMLPNQRWSHPELCLRFGAAAVVWIGCTGDAVVTRNLVYMRRSSVTTTLSSTLLLVQHTQRGGLAETSAVRTAGAATDLKISVRAPDHARDAVRQQLPDDACQLTTRARKARWLLCAERARYGPLQDQHLDRRATHDAEIRRPSLLC
jgi:hypothetical protein